jgi:hypothetical protein
MTKNKKYVFITCEDITDPDAFIDELIEYEDKWYEEKMLRESISSNDEEEMTEEEIKEEEEFFDALTEYEEEYKKKVGREIWETSSIEEDKVDEVDEDGKRKYLTMEELEESHRITEEMIKNNDLIDVITGRHKWDEKQQKYIFVVENITYKNSLT